MLRIQDCLELCELDEDEVLVIAQHEHIPAAAAAEYGHWLVQAPDGVLCIKAMLRDELERARREGRRDRALALKLVLRRFVDSHPDAEERRGAQPHAGERRQP